MAGARSLEESRNAGTERGVNHGAEKTFPSDQEMVGASEDPASDISFPAAGFRTGDQRAGELFLSDFQEDGGRKLQEIPSGIAEKYRKGAGHELELHHRNDPCLSQ